MDEKYAAVSFAELSRQMKALERSAGEFKENGKAEFEEVSGIELDLPESADRSYANALSEASKVERKLSAQYYDSSMNVPRPPSIGMQLTQKPMGRSKTLQPAPSKPGTGFPLQKAGAGTASFFPSYAPPPDEPSSPQTQAPITVVIPPHAPGAMPDLGKAVEESSAVQKKEGMLGSLFGSLSQMGRKKEARIADVQPSAPSISPKKLEELESMTLPTVLQSEDAMVSQQPPISQVPPPPSMPRQRAAPPTIPQVKKPAEMQTGQEDNAAIQDRWAGRQQMTPYGEEAEKTQEPSDESSEQQPPQTQEGPSQQPTPTKIDKISKSLSNIFPQQVQVPLLPPADESRTFAIKRKFEESESGEEQVAQQLQKKKAMPKAAKTPPPQKGKKQIPAAKNVEEEEAGLVETDDENESAESGLEAIIAKRKKEAPAYGRIQPEEAPQEDLDELIAKRKRASAFAPEPEEAEEPQQEDLDELIAKRKKQPAAQGQEENAAASDEDESSSLERVRERMLGKKPTGQKISSVMDEIERRLAEEEEEERHEAAQTPALRRLADVRRRISERQEEAGYVPEKEPKAAEEEKKPAKMQKEKPKPVTSGAKPTGAKDNGKFQVSIKPVFAQGENEDEEAEEEKPRAQKKSSFAKTPDEDSEEEEAEEQPQPAKKSRLDEAEQEEEPALQPRKAPKQSMPSKTRMPPKAKEEDMAEGQDEEFSPRATRRIAPIASALAKSGGIVQRQKAAMASGGAPTSSRMVSKASVAPVKKGPYTPSPPKGLAAKFAKRPDEKKQAAPPEEEEAPRKSYSSSMRRPQVMEPEDMAGEAQQGYAQRPDAGYAPRSRLRRPMPGQRSQYTTAVPPRMAMSRPTSAQGQQQEEGELAPPMPPVPKPSSQQQSQYAPSPQQQYPMQKGAYPQASQQPGQKYASAQGQSLQQGGMQPPAQGDSQAAPLPPIPSSEGVKESAKALGEEALIAYAKDNLKWLYEIYVMGGLTREDFVAKIKDKMNEISEQAQDSPAAAPANPALEKLEGMQKKFKK
jgi:hypothetical protein